MSAFGDKLRELRCRCRDPRNGRVLSQARLGELVGVELGDHGYSGQTISYWELGRTKLSVDDRRVLIALLTALHKCGGLQSEEEAEAFLQAGNYRALSPEEQTQVWGTTLVEHGVPPIAPSRRQSEPLVGSRQIEILQGLVMRCLRRWWAFRRLMSQVGRGTPPAWPRIAVWLVGALVTRIWASGLRRNLYWLALWVGNGYLTAPLFRWPYANQQMLFSAVGHYLVASLAIPVFIALGISTSNNPGWQARGAAGSMRLRLFTLQGASMGYSIGFMGVYWASLLWAAVPLPPLTLFAFLGAGLPLVVGVMSAHLIADNLWRAYGQLSLRANWVTFVFVVFGFLWAFFFIQLDDMFPEPRWQLTLWIIAFVLVTLWTQRTRKRARRGTSAEM